jgi:hypothetical protein
MLKGDPDRWAVIKEGFMTKAREIRNLGLP